MSDVRISPSRWLFLLLLLAAALTLAGCGGGGGSAAPANFSLGGQITTTPTRAATRAPLPPNIPVTGYLFPNLTTPVATTVTDSNGRYSLSFPHSATGKAAVIVAVQTVGSTTVRYSTIAANLTGSNVVDANADPATTLATEVILATAATATPAITNLSSSAFTTIASEFKNWSGIDGVDLTVGGANLPTTLGAGLKAGGPADTFLKGNVLITDSLKVIASSGDANVANGKASVQMVRSLLSGVVSNAQTEGTSLSAVSSSQQMTVSTGVQGASAFTTRFKFVSDLLGSNGFGAQALNGLASGTYTQTIDPETGFRILTRTGSAADGKSWVVTSATGDATNGEVATFTPATAIPAFALDPTAGSISLSVVKASDTALAYTATLAATLSGSTITTLNLTANLKDAALTQPITFNGTFVSIPAVAPTAAHPYAKVTLNGTLQSQFGTAQIKNLAASWLPTSQPLLVQDLQKVTMDSLTISTGFTPSASLSVTNLEVDFDLSQPSDGRHVSLKSIAFSGELKASNYDLAVTNFTLGFTPVVSGSTTQELPTTVQGQLSYTSPQMAFTGSVQGTWTNPNTNAGTLAGFPVGTLHLIGSLTPTVTKVTYAADVVLAGSVSGSNGVGTLTVNNLKLGSQTLAGTVTATYPTVNGQIDRNQATFALALTQQPTGVHVNIGGHSNSLTGTLTTGGPGTTKIADIGPANTLGLTELGSTAIIKYSDNTFESAASILP